MRAVSALGLVAVAGSPSASAHPLGNLSVNHYHGFRVADGVLVDDAVVDFAELPTVQARSQVDTNGDGQTSVDELDQYGRSQCDALNQSLSVNIDGQRLPMQVVSTSFVHREGQASLPTGRLECRLSASFDTTAPRTVNVVDSFLPDRVGWREMTAAADGLAIGKTSVPSVSVSQRLEAYPADLLSSPLAVTSASFEFGVAEASAASPTLPSKRVIPLENLGLFGTAVERMNRSFNDVVGRRQLTVGVGLLAIALALVLGASHAVLPGHGKTVMAAYIAGRQGSVRDAVLVGATVTATHTGGVLLLGVALTVSSSLAGESVLGWLGVISGLMIAGLGASLVVSAKRGTSSWHGHSHGPGGHTHGSSGHDHDDHTHSHGHGDHHGQDDHHHDHDSHSHDHGDDPRDHHHDHDHAGHGDRLVLSHGSDGEALGGVTTMVSPVVGHTGHAHPHTAVKPVSRRGLIGMGIAGGLVPSPSALVVLLSAIALGRTIFGVLLVVAYGVGMAGTLTLAGILLVRVRDRFTGRTYDGRGAAFARRWSRVAPFVTAAIVVVVGLGLVVRSLALV